MRHRTLTALLFVAVLPLVLSFGREIVAVDRCLDGGGSFDYEAMRCDMRESHNFVPYWRRHPILILASITAILGVGLGYLHRQSRSLA